MGLDLSLKYYLYFLGGFRMLKHLGTKTTKSVNSFKFTKTKSI